MKKVVYVLGAGVTHAAARLSSHPHGLLMSNIAEEAVQELGDAVRKLSAILTAAGKKLAVDTVNKIAIGGCNIEYVISLLDASGVAGGREVAELVRMCYAQALANLLPSIWPPSTKDLLAALVDFHCNEGSVPPLLDEQLIGFLTLNYDSFLERSIQSLHRGVDYLFGLSPLEKIDDSKGCGTLIPVLKLHGSLDWKIERLLDSPALKDPLSDYFMWIPPSAIKNNSHHPFALLWERAKAILECDIIRIVGCSLNASDWPLISLIYWATASPAVPPRIEMVDFPSQVDKAKDSAPLLSIAGIHEDANYCQHLLPAIGSAAGGSIPTDHVTKTLNDTAIYSPLRDWLSYRAACAVATLPKGVTAANATSGGYLPQIQSWGTAI